MPHHVALPATQVGLSKEHVSEGLGGAAAGRRYDRVRAARCSRRQGLPPSRRRDCHFAAPPSTFRRRFNRNKKGTCHQNGSLADGYRRQVPLPSGRAAGPTAFPSSVTTTLPAFTWPQTTAASGARCSTMELPSVRESRPLVSVGGRQSQMPPWTLSSQSMSAAPSQLKIPRQPPGKQQVQKLCCA